MNQTSLRDLRVLEAIAEDQEITQRRLAGRLGIALGLTNLFLQRLARKGCIKCVSIRPNRLKYLLTPKGAAEKVRLTYEFMQHSSLLYREARQHLHETLQLVVGCGAVRVAICGTGEVAKLAYLSLRELNVEPAAILDVDGPELFLGMPVRDARRLSLEEYNLIVATALADGSPAASRLRVLGARAEQILALSFDPRADMATRRRSPQGLSAQAQSGGGTRPPVEPAQ